MPYRPKTDAEIADLVLDDEETLDALATWVRATLNRGDLPEIDHAFLAQMRAARNSLAEGDLEVEGVADTEDEHANAGLGVG